MRTGSDTHLPSSEKTRTFERERAIEPSDARCLPSKPLVTAPTGRTSTQSASSPSRSTWSTMAAVSCVGVVLAIACTAV